MTVAIAYTQRSQSLSNVLQRLQSNSLVKQNIEPELKEAIGNDLEISYHLLPAEDVQLKFQTSVFKGLDDTEAAARCKRLGPNVLSPPKQLPLLLVFLKHLVSGFGLILIVAAILCFLAWRPFGDPPDAMNLGLGCVIVLVILLQGTFNFYQEHKSSKVLDSINKMLPENADVLRSGVVRSVPSSELTTGDIIIMKAGKKVPADCRLLTVSNFKIDKSQLTGENEPILCTDRCTDQNYMHSRNMAFFGSYIVEGTATALVVEIGNTTVMGKIAVSTSRTSGGVTTLQSEINHFVFIIVVLALTTATVSLLAWGLWLQHAHPGFLSFSAMLTNVIGLVVAFVPDGLPVSVTLTLTLIAKKMSKANVLVKNLTTVETLGSINLIASDKTGTLTMNRMTVSHMCWSDSILDDRDARKAASSEPICADLIEISALCNGANMTGDGINGDATDSALYRFADDLDEVRTRRERTPRVAVVPFNSRNKFMVSIHRIEDGKKQYCMLYMKGAPEIILEHCAFGLNERNNQVPLTSAMKEKWLKERQEALGKLGERVLGFAKMSLPVNEYPVDFKFDVDDINFPITGLTFVGIISLIDPPREAVPPALQICKTAGIKVMMVTGDHPSTGAAIAKRCGIITVDEVESVADAGSKPCTHDCDRAVVIVGSEIPSFDDRMWDWVLHHNQIVFARTTPDQKLQIVIENQKRGRVVAVTGDGVNDAPALKKADVGVAMGAGSEVSKEAADMVLLDDNFASLIKGIELGRLVFDNLKKVLLFLLPAGSFSEMLPILANVFLGMPLPLSPFLMIVICIGTDVFPSLALVTEKAELEIMLRKPRNIKKDHLADFKLLAYAYFNIGLIESFAAFLGYFWYLTAQGFSLGDIVFAYDAWTDGYHGFSQQALNEMLFASQSIFFLTLVIVQFGTVLAVRTRHMPFARHNPFSANPNKRNMHFLSYCCCSALMAVLVIVIPFMNDVFNTRQVEFKYIAPAFGFAVFIFLWDDLRKQITLKRPHGFIARLAW
eukprot:GILK01006204.1.p1 GENE.GILK01006204.1~~GILK01006204.1.p1  ORF type:complete len:1066 (+),score=189.62 GILK01006204.1:170-3199(+)